MELIFIDPNEIFCQSMQSYLDELPVIGEEAMVQQGTYQDLGRCDCVICPANSFGLPDREHYSRMIEHLGEDLSARIQNRILEDYCGELPVGTSLIVETLNPNFPRIAYTPVMRVSMPVSYMDNVYYGLFSALLAIRHYNQTHTEPICSVACPSMGTGAGRVPPAQAARQLSLAYRNFMCPPQRLEWHGANNRQQEVRYGGDSGFGFPPEWA